MNAKQIFEALLAGKKVGQNRRWCYYLDSEGELTCPDYDYEDADRIGVFFSLNDNKIIPEEVET